jgi:hypothetical protein
MSVNLRSKSMPVFHESRAVSTALGTSGKAVLLKKLNNKLGAKGVLIVPGIEQNRTISRNRIATRRDRARGTHVCRTPLQIVRFC